jgi:hypothetical protein
MKEVGIMFQPVVTETLDVAQQSADKDPAQMDDAQIRQIMEAAPLMRQLLEAVEKEAMRRMELGISIPGLKLVNGRGSRAGQDGHPQGRDLRNQTRHTRQG